MNHSDLVQWFEADFDNIFYIGNERRAQDKLLAPEYCASDTYPNVLCLEYDDLMYDDEEELREVVRYVKNKIRDSFPYFSQVELLEEEAVQRLIAMSESYAEYNERGGKATHNQNRYGIGGGGASNHILQKATMEPGDE
ncbi:MAG: hypothetical protein SGARI_008278 [Bacillariaceae sp.]